MLRAPSWRGGMLLSSRGSIDVPSLALRCELEDARPGWVAQGPGVGLDGIGRDLRRRSRTRGSRCCRKRRLRSQGPRFSRSLHLCDMAPLYGCNHHHSWQRCCKLDLTNDACKLNPACHLFRTIALSHSCFSLSHLQQSIKSPSYHPCPTCHCDMASTDQETAESA